MLVEEEGSPIKIIGQKYGQGGFDDNSGETDYNYPINHDNY